jgi:type I restriction enzyme S subunit
VTPIRLATLGKVVETPRTWDPAKVAPDAPFQYVDLSAVNQESKTIDAPRMVPGREAPSRARQLVARGDVLVSTVRPNLNAVAVVPDELDSATASTGFCVLRPVPGLLDSRYLFHWVRTPQFVGNMVNHATGASYPAVSNRIIGQSTIPLPPLAEQRRIADVLDRTDVLRVKRRAALATVDIATRSIFMDMFGDPVSNPKRWPTSVLGALLTFQQYGPRFYNESYSPDGVRIVRITDLDESGELDFAHMPKLAVSQEDLEKYSLRPGDLLFARTGATVGKVALVDAHSPPCIAGAYFITMRFTPDVEPVFVRFVLTSPALRRFVTDRSRQAAQQNFSGPALRALTIPVPPHALQQRFAETLKPVDALRIAQRDSLNRLDALFSSVQHHAFRGEL